MQPTSIMLEIMHACTVYAVAAKAAVGSKGQRLHNMYSLQLHKDGSSQLAAQLRIKLGASKAARDGGTQLPCRCLRRCATSAAGRAAE